MGTSSGEIQNELSLPALDNTFSSQMELSSHPSDIDDINVMIQQEESYRHHQFLDILACGAPDDDAEHPPVVHPSTSRGFSFSANNQAESVAVLPKGSCSPDHDQDVNNSEHQNKTGYSPEVHLSTSGMHPTTSFAGNEQTDSVSALLDVNACIGIGSAPPGGTNFDEKTATMQFNPQWLHMHACDLPEVDERQNVHPADGVVNNVESVTDSIAQNFWLMPGEVYASSDTDSVILNEGTSVLPGGIEYAGQMVSMSKEEPSELAYPISSNADIGILNEGMSFLTGEIEIAGQVCISGKEPSAIPFPISSNSSNADIILNEGASSVLPRQIATAGQEICISEEQPSEFPAPVKMFMNGRLQDNFPADADSEGIQADDIGSLLQQFDSFEEQAQSENISGSSQGDQETGKGCLQGTQSRQTASRVGSAVSNRDTTAVNPSPELLDRIRSRTDTQRRTAMLPCSGPAKRGRLKAAAPPLRDASGGSFRVKKVLGKSNMFLSSETRPVVVPDTAPPNSTKRSLSETPSLSLPSASIEKKRRGRKETRSLLVDAPTVLNAPQNAFLPDTTQPCWTKKSLLEKPSMSPFSASTEKTRGRKTTYVPVETVLNPTSTVFLSSQMGFADVPGTAQPSLTNKSSEKPWTSPSLAPTEKNVRSQERPIMAVDGPAVLNHPLTVILPSEKGIAFVPGTAQPGRTKKSLSEKPSTSPSSAHTEKNVRGQKGRPVMVADNPDLIPQTAVSLLPAKSQIPIQPENAHGKTQPIIISCLPTAINGKGGEIKARDLKNRGICVKRLSQARGSRTLPQIAPKLQQTVSLLTPKHLPLLAPKPSQTSTSALKVDHRNQAVPNEVKKKLPSVAPQSVGNCNGNGESDTPQCKKILMISNEVNLPFEKKLFDNKGVVFSLLDHDYFKDSPRWTEVDNMELDTTPQSNMQKALQRTETSPAMTLKKSALQPANQPTGNKSVVQVQPSTAKPAVASEVKQPFKNCSLKQSKREQPQTTVLVKTNHLQGKSFAVDQVKQPKRGSAAFIGNQPQKTITVDTKTNKCLSISTVPTSQPQSRSLVSQKVPSVSYNTVGARPAVRATNSAAEAKILAITNICVLTDSLLQRNGMVKHSGSSSPNTVSDFSVLSTGESSSPKTSTIPQSAVVSQVKSCQSDVFYSMPTFDDDGSESASLSERIVAPHVTGSSPHVASNHCATKQSPSPFLNKTLPRAQANGDSDAVVPTDDRINDCDIIFPDQDTTSSSLSHGISAGEKIHFPDVAQAQNDFSSVEYGNQNAWEEMEEEELSRLLPNTGVDGLGLFPSVENNSVNRNAGQFRGLPQQRKKRVKNSGDDSVLAVESGCISKLPDYIGPSNPSIQRHSGQKEVTAADIEAMDVNDCLPLERFSDNIANVSGFSKLPNYTTNPANSTLFDTHVLPSSICAIGRSEKETYDFSSSSSVSGSELSDRAEPAPRLRSRLPKSKRGWKDAFLQNDLAKSPDSSSSQSRLMKRRRRSSSGSRSSPSSRSSESPRSSSYNSHSPRSGSRSPSHSRSNSRRRVDSRRRRDESRGQRQRRSSSRDLDRRQRETMNQKVENMKRRKIVYVGGIPSGYTKSELRRQFEIYGAIEAVSVHFREDQDNYGFVTYRNPVDAHKAVEAGNRHSESGFQISYGGRREFCTNRYSDLDGNFAKANEFHLGQGVNVNDFQSWLHQYKQMKN